MNTLRWIPSIILLVAVSVGSAPAQQRVRLGENAALRYWSAFAQMQDSAITDQQAQELNAILDGTAPYDDVKYKELVEKNRPALETIARASPLPNCDWGVDYQLGPDAPVDYVRKALAMGRLNVLYAFHLLIAGDRDRAVRVLATGLRFSHDVASGGTLFATVAAKDLIAAHLRAVAFVLHMGELSVPQRLVLQRAVAQLGAEGLEWQSALRRELEVFRGLDSQASASLARIIPTYITVLNNPSMLPTLQRTIAVAPRPLPDIIPSPKRVLEEKQDLTARLLQIGALLH
jgi:hypothetical protein